MKKTKQSQSQKKTPEAGERWRYLPWQPVEGGIGYELLLTNHSRGCLLDAEYHIIEYQRNENLEFCIARALSRSLAGQARPSPSPAAIVRSLTRMITAMPLSYVKDMIRAEGISTERCVVKDDYIRRYVAYSLDPANSKEKAPRVPRRPDVVLFEAQQQQREVQPMLHAWNLRSAVQPLPDKVRRRLPKMLYYVLGSHGFDDLLLQVPNMSADLVAKFFAVARKFYNARPWRYLTEEDTFTLSIGDRHRLVHISGHKGEGRREAERASADYFQSGDCGLYMKHSRGQTDPLTWTPEERDNVGLESLDFAASDAVPISEEKAMLEHGWTLAGGVEGFLNDGHHTFPYPTVALPWTTAAETVGEEEEEEDEEEEGDIMRERRPMPEELRWFIYALVAVRKWITSDSLRCVGVDEKGAPVYEPHTFAVKLGEHDVRISFPTDLKRGSGRARCAFCNSTAKLRRCGRCRGGGYCSVECQRQHWPTHKPFCLPATQPASK